MNTVILGLLKVCIGRGICMGVDVGIMTIGERFI